jgi:TatD DNase family protein
MGIIETHAHLYTSQFNEDRQQLIDHARSIGVDQFLMPNVDHRSIDKMLEIEAQNPRICIPMMGLHPCSVAENFEKELEIVENWLSKRSFCAIGEIGMDLHWDVSFLEQQKEAFKIQVQWAKEYKLPIVIHARKANQELLEILENTDLNGLKGVFHCFSGSAEEAKRVKDLGFYLGIGGVVTFKNGGLDKVLTEVGFDRLVLETDCPYLAPHPHRGKRNEPAYIDLVAHKLAQLTEKSYFDIVNETTANAKELFSL